MRQGVINVEMEIFALVTIPGGYVGRQAMHLEQDEAVLIDDLRPASKVLDGALEHVAQRNGLALGLDVDVATGRRSPRRRLAVLRLPVGAIVIEERPHV